LDLPGSSGLAQVEPRRCSGDATGVGNGEEGAQLMEVHAYLPKRLLLKCIKVEKINALDK
jgi:hypothetical protein